MEEDNGSCCLWEPAECGDKVTDLTGRRLGSDPCRARDFSVSPKYPYRLLRSTCPPVQRGPASVPSSVQRPGPEVGQSLIRMLMCGSAIMECVGTALFIMIFIAQTVFTACARTNYKIVPVSNLNKYLYYGPKQALQYKPKGRRHIGRPRKRWRDQFHFEDTRNRNQT